MAEATPLMRQYLEQKAAHPDALLFFRLGDFYEMFYEDAELAARELGITLTSRDGNIPMAGVPVGAVEGYLARLLERGYRVAISEQMGDPALARGLVRRQVVRVVSPGTVVEERGLDSRRDNLLLALWPAAEGVGVAAVDISTGKFLCTEFAGRDAPTSALEEAFRFSPREVVWNSRWRTAVAERWTPLREGRVVTDRPQLFDGERALQRVLDRAAAATLVGAGLGDTPLGTRAAGVLLGYLEETGPLALRGLGAPVPYRTAGTLVLDTQARRHLELTENGSGGREYTLLQVLDETCTPMGARLLGAWIRQPLTDPGRIGERLDAVQFFVEETVGRERLRPILRGVGDISRIVGRLVSGGQNPRDLGALRHALQEVRSVRAVLGPGLLPTLLGGVRQRLAPDAGLLERLERELADEVPTQVREGGVIRSGFDPEVDRLRLLSRDSRQVLTALEEEERAATGLKVRIGYNRVFGYYLEVGRKESDRVPPRYLRKQTLANAERFVTPRLKQIEEELNRAQELLLERESALFGELRQAVCDGAAGLREVAEAVALLDVMAALADVAVVRRYVRPVLTTGSDLRIEGGRHPVVEAAMGGGFVPNDVRFDESRRLLILTGPNMAGKSTYMRQTALIVLMAQLGSFVPADRAEIGICDRIFTRIGAGDNLARGESTFMVEMSELSAILRGATDRSLLVLDEIGRGTSTYDGLALAWAVVEDVHDRIGARCLLATHYHELIALGEELPRSANVSMAVAETGGEVRFLRSVVEGGADRSYGIHVAQLAGLPAAVLARAASLLERLPAAAAVAPAPLPPPAPAPHPLLLELADLSIDELRPVDALLLLARLQERAREVLIGVVHS